MGKRRGAALSTRTLGEISSCDCVLCPVRACVHVANLLWVIDTIPRRKDLHRNRPHGALRLKGLLTAWVRDSLSQDADQQIIHESHHTDSGC